MLFGVGLKGLRGCLVEEFEKCCLSVFDIRVGEKVCKKMCNVV